MYSESILQKSITRNKDDEWIYDACLAFDHFLDEQYDIDGQNKRYAIGQKTGEPD